MSEDVLIVDDNRNFCVTFSDLLKEKGFNVEYVFSVREAFELLKNKEYKVVFVDMKMPGMNGPDTIKELVKINRATAIIGVTGSGDFDLVREAVTCGARGCIYKPMYYNDIDKIISMYLEM